MTTWSPPVNCISRNIYHKGKEYQFYQEMKISRSICVLSLLLSCVMTMTAQFTLNGKRPAFDDKSNTLLLTVPREQYGQPLTVTIVLDDSISWASFDGVRVGSEFTLPLVNGDTTYAVQYRNRVKGLTRKRAIRFTYFPIMRLVGTFSDVYADGEIWMTMPDDTTVTEIMPASIKWAGSSTNRPWYHKHNFHIKFRDAEGNKMDRSFMGLRSDNHWRLDAGLIDMGRIRNKMAHALWADMSVKPYYAEQQPNVRNYSRGFFVDVFLNQRYLGFYDMTEYLDRKQMKLKKYDDENDEFHGMLWKAKNETWQTLFVADSACNNRNEMWCGYEVKYPDFDDVNPTDFHLLRNAIRFVQNSSDDDFREQVGDYFDLPVLTDYYVFMNVLLAFDNTCKNIIWGCYDGAVDKKLTLAVWDLDATVGQHWSDLDGYYRSEMVGPENELTAVSLLRYNALFNRLMEWPDFRMRVINRYWQLRNNVLTPDSLIGRFATAYDLLRDCGAIKREEMRFSGDSDINFRVLDFNDEFEYLSDWFRRRIVFLDHHTFQRSLHGDVDGDGEVSISDVNCLIDILLGAPADDATMARADVDGDGEVAISDVNALIDLLLTM